VPGTAKTLLARAVAKALGLRFGRAQFTPDMLPSDLTGTVALRGNDLVFRPGPVFTNVLLADEINRTPPKTQSALLESMAEGQVTVDAESHALPEPFIVVATQNPIEYEGTYPLPEAQLDRFLFKVIVDYPDAEHERQMIRTHRSIRPDVDSIETVTNADEILSLRSEARTTEATDDVVGYVADIIRRTRELPSVELGASPRAGIHLMAAARAKARMQGRDYVTPDDAASMAPLVLRHRILVRPEAELERYTPDDAVRATLASVNVPR
jgi:MoxR-like ATPase